MYYTYFSIFLIFAASLGLVPQGPYTPLESVSTSQLSTLTRNTLYSKHWISIEPENYYILSTTPIWTEYRSTSGTDTYSGEQIRVDFYPIQIRNENNESFVLALETSNDDHVTNYLYGTRTIQGTLKTCLNNRKIHSTQLWLGKTHIHILSVIGEIKPLTNR